MKKMLIASALSIIALIAAVPAAFASPVVVSGSSYALYYAGSVSGNAHNLTTTFDNLADVRIIDGLTITLSESDTDLGGGVNQIDLDLRSNGNLFPSPDDDSQYGVGIFGDGLDFFKDVTLSDASLDLYALDGSLLASLALGVPPGTPDPWDGIYPLLGNIVEIGTAGNPISGFTFHFLVNSQADTPPPAGVPEPGSLMLFAAAVIAAALWQRRRAG